MQLPYVYSELYSFINALGDDYKNKLPQNLYKTIKERRDKMYKPVYHADQEIKKGDMSKASIVIINAMFYKYWASEEEKKKLLKKIIENTKNKKDTQQ